MPGDDIWDENRWERFLRENDRRVDRYMDLIFGFMVTHPRPKEDPEALHAWRAAFRAFLEEKGWRPEDSLLPFLWMDDPEQAIPPEDADESFPGPAWEEDAPEDEASDDDVFDLPIYRQAFQLTRDVLDWAHGLPAHVKDGTFVHYCACVTQIPGSLAKGHAMGYDQEMIGGNIACVKRGLRSANAALQCLAELKEKPYLEAGTYRRLCEETFELRNALGLYVQTLRERFDLGID